MSTKTIRDPVTNRVIATTTLNDDGRIEGTVNIFLSTDSDSTPSARLVVKPKRNESGYIDKTSCEIPYSELINKTNNSNLLLTNTDNILYFKNEHKESEDNIRTVELKGLLMKDNKDIVYDGTTSEISYPLINLSTTLKTNSSGDVKLLSELILTTKNGTSLKNNYLEVGEGNKILSSHLYSNTNVELLRKIYKDQNINKPLLITIKNIAGDIINGEYKGQQVPTVKLNS